MASLVKKHLRPGSILLSDAHSSYVNMKRGVSHYNHYAFYHDWINHSEQYAH
jgi:hypothetical protein